jgi:cysteine desulfurase
LIYLDHNATTPVAPEVRDAMAPYLEQHFGNPSSAHEYGAVAAEAVWRARAQVAALLGCEPEHIVFTAGGSEADNLAIKGLALTRAGGHLITSAVEHPGVRGACRYLERRHGFRLTVVPVDGTGRVDPDDVRRAIASDTVLISIMHANNEVGTLQPVAEIARECDVIVHTERGFRPRCATSSTTGSSPAPTRRWWAGSNTDSGTLRRRTCTHSRWS